MKRNCTTSMYVSQALIICIPNSTVISDESWKNHITNTVTIEEMHMHFQNSS